MGMKALVIIPAYNEEAFLGSVLDDLTTAQPEVDVLVVSDGSTDATASVAREAGAAVIDLPFNLGIGGALRAGFRYAVEEGYDAAVQFDADGQHDHEGVSDLLGVVEGGADLVIGSRFVGGASPDYDVGRARRAAMRLLEVVVRHLVGQSFSDTSSGFRGFSRPMLTYFATHYPVEYMDSVESLVMAVNAGYVVQEVPARIFVRRGGVPSTRGWRLVYYYCRLLVVLVVSYVRPRHRPEIAATRKPPTLSGSSVDSGAR